jgi:hypothetical protein
LQKKHAERDLWPKFGTTSDLLRLIQLESCA